MEENKGKLFLKTGKVDNVLGSKVAKGLLSFLLELAEGCGGWVKLQSHARHDLVKAWRVARGALAPQPTLHIDTCPGLYFLKPRGHLRQNTDRCRQRKWLTVSTLEMDVLSTSYLYQG